MGHHVKNMSSSDESSGDMVDMPVVRKGKGSTHMGALIAFGREEDNFISYLGFLARSKVRIVYSAWKFVPDKTKELIWAKILKAGTKDDRGRAAANEGSFPIRSFHRYPAPSVLLVTKMERLRG
ncbi:hypothetical protein K1719_027490 [Acacia pycnantha]|nr:hypothetical protein K1719_027490 [Acacia pycnantha]